MTSSLGLLFEAINQTQSEQDMRSQIVPKIGEYFAATRSGIFFFDSLEDLLRKRFPSLDRKLEKILKFGLSVEHNPVVRYLVERHAPVHEALVSSPKAWAILCPRPDHWHVMIGPIVHRGQLVGAVACTREKSSPAFDTQNLLDLSAISLHLSVWVATLRSQSASISAATPQYQPCRSDRLTPRELQIAELVALGRTNLEIGKELWITENSVKQALKRMFRKLEVSSRAEMVAMTLGAMQTGVKEQSLN
ncbi:LuxR C-terminal-related transcriptional regulator [Tumidithrix elongata RA019]|uniref:LuxR C-terminal-related transcriptional regulator n=1 Tax=Tumidithrix elongata BACA0141 TaxID=2716417 RepID=A0AAW9Q4B9_9CYAN|nr:LuxR C-terminal-related transcriptional regulator [Tumidithrix elongata RA019]